jgi:hypothetical protein
MRDVPHRDPDASQASPVRGLSFGWSRGLASVVITSIDPGRDVIRRVGLTPQNPREDRMSRSLAA